jgi:hypothetical protein
LQWIRTWGKHEDQWTNISGIQVDIGKLKWRWLDVEFSNLLNDEPRGSRHQFVWTNTSHDHQLSEFVHHWGVLRELPILWILGLIELLIDLNLALEMRKETLHLVGTACSVELTPHL